METKQKKRKVVASVLALAGLAVFSLFAVGGSLEPNSPPGPTMKTLDEIYDAVIGVSQREGYIGHFDVFGGFNKTCFTVPTGKQFVLLNVNLEYVCSTASPMYLTVDGNFFTGGSYFRSYYQSYAIPEYYYADFPDRCVVVNANETLRVVNDSGSGPYKALIVGYFHDVE